MSHTGKATPTVNKKFSHRWQGDRCDASIVITISKATQQLQNGEDLKKGDRQKEGHVNVRSIWISIKVVFLRRIRHDPSTWETDGFVQRTPTAISSAHVTHTANVLLKSVPLMSRNKTERCIACVDCGCHRIDDCIGVIMTGHNELNGSLVAYDVTVEAPFFANYVGQQSTVGARGYAINTEHRKKQKTNRQLLLLQQRCSWRHMMLSTLQNTSLIITMHVNEVIAFVSRFWRCFLVIKRKQLHGNEGVIVYGERTNVMHGLIQQSSTLKNVGFKRVVVSDYIPLQRIISRLSHANGGTMFCKKIDWFLNWIRSSCI